ncbi:hypothetical protein [Nocardia sp. NPDC127526]|uniref:hypothetical protein n=1 Tax=Nocardia sp. NPDC127526 TaxID=3345393 RepID=UPI0036398357
MPLVALIEPARAPKKRLSPTLLADVCDSTLNCGDQGDLLTTQHGVMMDDRYMYGVEPTAPTNKRWPRLWRSTDGNEQYFSVPDGCWYRATPKYWLIPVTESVAADIEHDAPARTRYWAVYPWMAHVDYFDVERTEQDLEQPSTIVRYQQNGATEHFLASEGWVPSQILSAYFNPGDSFPDFMVEVSEVEARSFVSGLRVAGRA